MNDTPKSLEIDPPLPTSAQIRARLEAAKVRFHANDNIAAYLQPGDREALLEEVTSKMQGVLESLVIDTESDHNTNETARRVISASMSRRCSTS